MPPVRQGYDAIGGPVARTTASAGTAAVVTHRHDRREARRDEQRDDRWLRATSLDGLASVNAIYVTGRGL